MASFFHFTFLLFVFVLLNHPPATSATATSSVETYTIDPVKPNHTPRNKKFPKKIKKGQKCTSSFGHRFDICHGVPANQGTVLVRCCQKRCIDAFTDNNNCGTCRKKCSFGKMCCRGKCIDVLHNRSRCGSCNNKCARGVKCENGICGYA